jgi:predicted  nucleic acid-binding Zn-ribbon protein
MGAFEQLLVVQGHDTKLDQLRHRRETLPERAAHVAKEGEIAALDAEAAAVTAERDEHARTQRHREDELAALEAKISEVDRHLYGGGVTSPREAVDMQAELESLNKRRGVLEENVIEVMEVVDPLNERLDEFAAARAALVEGLDALAAVLAEAESGLDQEILAVEAERSQAVEGVAPDQLEHYETLRKQLGGIGVARLSGGTCGGCNLNLSAAEIDRIKHEPADALIHCEECGRILVR